MKQQEILRKIGNILKELNEQYDYLQAEETHTNDLELELFAANAKFLTDHTEILRKINAQALNVRLSLPEHHETEAAQLQLPAVEQEPTNYVAEPAKENFLPPLAESAITYEEPFMETEPVAAEKYQEPVQEFSFQPTVEREPEPQIFIEPEKEYDSYNFVRNEPQVSNEQHSFSISSHNEEEPAPPHVDLTTPEPGPEPIITPVAVEPEPVQTYYHNPEPEETPKVVETEQPVFTHEAYTPVEPEQSQVTQPEPEPMTEEPVVKHYEFTEVIQAPEHNVIEQNTSSYIPPVTEAPKPEQPLTLNERLSAQLRPNTVTSSPIQQTPAASVSDIKSAISLNDKMLFVKDLFNGYSLAYSEAIELVNRCKSFDEADRFLKSNYVTKNNWVGKPDTADKFYAILHRRFTA